MVKTGQHGFREIAELAWTAGDVPVSRRHGDTYFSSENGLDESRHVFLRGNGLPERFRPGFRIAELGFGTGLNMLAAWKAWDDSGPGGVLEYVGFENCPVSAGDMDRALRRWPELSDRARILVGSWSGGKTRIRIGSLAAEIVPGDARLTVSEWPGSADAWFLDGFSPESNPSMWEAELLGMVGTRTRPGGTVATFSAAGHVRRRLCDAGFEVWRTRGYGRKRHMTKGRLATS